MAQLWGVEPLFGAPLTASCLIVPVCKRLPQRTPSLLPAGPGSGNHATGSGAWRTIRGLMEGRGVGEHRGNGRDGGNEGLVGDR